VPDAQVQAVHCANALGPEDSIAAVKREHVTAVILDFMLNILVLAAISRNAARIGSRGVNSSPQSNRP
jgi:hypothetical protein